MRMKTKIAPLLAVFLAAAPALALDLGGIGQGAMKLWEKKDAIVKTTKALRKGFAELTMEEEYYIGRSVAARILSQYKPVADKKRTEYINTLGNVLARYSSRPETFSGYHFMLVESDEVNAFAAPSGFIFITTGLYSKVASEEQLAAVLAHEISHVTLKHGLSAIKSSRLTEAFTIIGTEAVKEYSSAEVAQLTAAFEGTIDDVVNKMVVSGYSRSQEYDADAEALRIVYKAGYDPSGLMKFLKNLSEQKSKSKGLGFYKTHPPADERLKKAESVAKKEKLEGESAPTRAERFRKYAM